MVDFSVPFSMIDADYLWLKEYAAGEGKSVDEFIQDLIKYYVKTTKPMV